MDISELFGADQRHTSVEKLTLYLPDVDGRQQPYPDFGTWVETAATLFAYVNQGSTRVAPADGKWWEDLQLISERTTLVYSFVNQKRFNRNAESVAQFVHTFGQRTNQKTVMIEASGEWLAAGREKDIRYRSRAYFISAYPKAVDPSIPLEELLDHLLPDPLP